MKKIIKSLLLLAAVTAGTGTFVSCSDDDDLTTADALFRPIINTDDNIEQGLDNNTVPTRRKSRLPIPSAVSTT